MNEPIDPLTAAIPPGEFMSIDIKPAHWREIIAGLRALPNVSEMAIIQAIGELDRIASMFERAEKRREELTQQAIEAVRKAVIEGKAEATPGCECARCMMIRNVLAREEQKKPQLNS